MEVMVKLVGEPVSYGQTTLYSHFSNSSRMATG